MKKAPEDQFTLYLRGSTWWAKIGNFDGKSIRISCHTSDRQQAEEAARAARARLLTHRRETATLRLANLVNEGTDWQTFIDSRSGAELVKRLHRNASQRARERGGFLPVGVEQVRSLLVLSKGRCAVSGLELVRDGPRRHPRQASLDRIDNSRGYTASNLRVVALGVNLAMNVWGEEEFLSIALGTAGLWMARESAARFRIQSDADVSRHTALTA